MHPPKPSGGLLGVSNGHGGLSGPPPGDGLHGYGVGAPHGGLAFGGGDSGHPEFGMQCTRIAVSSSPTRISTFGRSEYESE